jgi:Family of unknown function (DUF5317)
VLSRPQVNFPHLGVLVSPYVLLGLGVFLNVLVITANQGYMPVAPSSIIDGMAIGPTHPGLVLDEIHRVMQSSDHLKFLADWIQIPRMSVASPGDLFLWLSDCIRVPSFIVWLTMLWKDCTPAGKS